MDWEDIIAQLADELALPELRLDADGRAALLVDDRITVELAVLPHGLVAFCRAGKVPEFAREDIFAAMLAANIPDGGLAGACLGVDGEEAVASIAWPAGVQAAGVMEGLKNVISAAEAWRKRLGE